MTDRRNKLIGFIFIFLLSTTTYGQTSTIFGKYVSNWGEDTLIIKTDSTFKIIGDSANSSFELSGDCKIEKYSVRFINFNQGSEHINYWSCIGLKRKRKYLTRPLHCGPTHRSLIFIKIK